MVVQFHLELVKHHDQYPVLRMPLSIVKVCTQCIICKYVDAFLKDEMFCNILHTVGDQRARAREAHITSSVAPQNRDSGQKETTNNDSKM